MGTLELVNVGGINSLNDYLQPRPVQRQFMRLILGERLIRKQNILNN